MIFALNGRQYTNIHIVSYSVKLETLDGEGTGRSKAAGWPMIRDPQGQIINLDLEFAGLDSNKSDFAHLWSVCRNMGNSEFALVRFVDPLGGEIEQNMYLVASELKYKRIDANGTVYSSALKVSFVAERGY